MNDIMDQIIESLAFEIEAVPNETKGQMSTGFYNDPINLKIRIKNKDQNKILRQGIISLPKSDGPTYSSDKIQLSNSDQTIMSFNVLMERDESTNKQRKHKRKFRFFKRGNCLGNQTEEDQKFPNRGNMDTEQLAPIKSTSINDMNKRNFTLTKMYVSSDTRRMENRTHKDILGKCKPGGCLDPPYGEDKYSYVPKLIQMSRTEKHSSKRKSNDVAYQKSINNNENKNVKDEIGYVSENKEQLSLQTNINLSNTKHSNSIITYPSISSNESLNKGNIKKTVPYNDNNSKLSNISNKIVETYFISPKKIKIRHDELQEESMTDFDAEKHSFVKPLSKDQKVLDELNPELLKNYENTKTEGDIDDPKISIQSDNEKLIKNDIHLTSQTSLANLSRNEKNALNPVQNEVYTKDSLTSLTNTIPLYLDTDSLKVSSNPIPMFSASPKMIYKVSSDTTIPYTKKSLEQVENNKEETNKKPSLDTFNRDQSFISKELDNLIEMTEHEKEKSYEENRNDLELEHLLQNEEVKIISKFSSNESVVSNQSLIRQNKITKEITNLDTDSKIPDTSISFKKSSSKISIMNSDLAQKENIATLNQDLIITKMHQNLNSDFSYVDIKKSISLTETDNDAYLEQKYEQTLLDTEFDLSILSNDGMKEASVQEIDTKNVSLTERIEIHNSICSNDINEAPIENIADDDRNSFTVPTGLKESNDQVVLTNNNDLQVSEKIEIEKFFTHDTNPDKTSIRSVKSNIDNSNLFIDIQDTELGKIQNSPLATRSLTSMEKDLNEYNTLQSHLLSEPEVFDSASALDGIVDPANIDITANSINETVEKTSIVNNNVDPENSFIEKIKFRSNLSLSINECVKTPPPEKIQFVSDKNDILTEVSIDHPKKLKSDNPNIISSANEVNLQNSQEPFVKLEEDSFKNGVSSVTAKSSMEAGLEVSREEVSSTDVETSKNDQSSDIRETSITITDNNTNKTNECDLIRPLSKDSNLKDTVYLNMAFQSFYSEKDGNVIRTIESTNKEVERYEDDNILQFMTLARLDDVHVSIPIDSEKKLLLQITKTSEKEDQNAEIIEKVSVSAKQDPKHKLVAFNEDNNDTFSNSDLDKKKIKVSIKNSTKIEGNIQLTLDNVYNQKLLPLHNMIKDLKRDIDRLLKQQLIKDKLHNDQQIQLNTISKNYKKCICIEQLFLKH